MEGNLIHTKSIPKSAISAQKFNRIALFTFIVYFITAFSGWFNFLFAFFSKRSYFPLRSYLITFGNNEIVNNIGWNILNLAGYKTTILSKIPYKLIDDIFFTSICLLLIILFVKGYKLIESNQALQPDVIRWALIFSTLMAFSIPSHSSDLYGYIARGAQQTLFNHNPYITPISNIEGYSSYPLFLNFMWPHQPTTYGPIFILLCKSILLLSNNNFLLSFFNFKILNLVLYLLVILFVLKSTDTKNLYLIAWNPLLLFQVLWNCHNDLISGVLIFFSFYFLNNENHKNRHFWSLFYLTIAAGIKYVSALIIPFVILYIIRKEKNKLTLLNSITGIICGVILILIFSVDYLFSGSHISAHGISQILSNIGLVHKSLIATLYTLLKYTFTALHLDFPSDLAIISLKGVVYSLFIIFYLYRLFKCNQNLVLNVGLMLFVFFGFTLAKFHSWYLLNLVVLIPFPLLNDDLRKIIIALSLTHVFAITFLDQAKILNFTFMTLLPVLYLWFTRAKKSTTL